MYSNSLGSSFCSNGVIKGLGNDIRYSGFYKYKDNINLSFNFIKTFITNINILHNLLFFKILNNPKTNSLHLFEYLQTKVVYKYNNFNITIFIINFFSIQSISYKNFIKVILNILLTFTAILLIITFIVLS
jgi:hypothetical protein